MKAAPRNPNTKFAKKAPATRRAARKRAPAKKAADAARPVPQEALLHVARRARTPDIFHEAPERMPFSTEQ